jgi:hypothetical protein
VSTFWVGLLTIGVHAAASGDELGELWRLKVGTGVEWAECVEGEGRTWIIVCSRDARVYTLDAATGEVSGEPVAAGPGLRFAGARSGTAYLFDRYVVYALDLDGSPGRLRWRCGSWPPTGDVGDDPEFLTPIVAAGACAEGVVAVRSDGRLALLHERTGTPRWQRQVGPLNYCHLLLGPITGVVLHRAGGRTVGVVLRPLVQPLPAVTVDPRVGWPIWSALDGEELVLAELTGVRRVPLDGGRACSIEVPRGERLLAPAIDCETREGEPGQRLDHPRLAAIWAGSDTGAVYRFDLVSGAVRTIVEPPARNAERWTGLRLCRRAVLVHSDKQCLTLGISNPRVIARYAAGEGEVIRAAGVVGETICLIVVPLPAGEQNAAAQLIYFPLPATDTQAAAEAPEHTLRTAGAEIGRCHLSGSEGVRLWLWSGPRLVAVGPEALAAYALPVSAVCGD